MNKISPGTAKECCNVLHIYGKMQILKGGYSIYKKIGLDQQDDMISLDGARRGSRACP